MSLACRFIRLAFAWISLAGATVVHGAEDVPALHPRIWRTDAGLLHNSVNHIIQDHAGFLWIGGLGGLARFDGREFKEVKIPPEYRSRGYNIRGLAEESPGTLLVLSTSGVVLRVREDGVTPHPVMEKLDGTADRPAAFFVEPGGVVWVATQGGRLARWQPDGVITLFAEASSVAPRTRRFTFAIDQAGSTWVGTDGFLAVYRDGVLQPAAGSVPESLILSPGRGGNIWVCTPDSLLRLEHGRLRLVTQDVPWSDNFGSFRRLIEDSEGVLWIALSRQGLVRFAGERMAMVPTPSTSIACLFQDREGLLWAGTNGEGLCRLSVKSHRIVDASAGLSASLVSSISTDADDRVWLANRLGGLVGLKPAGGFVQEGAEKRSHVFANVVMADRQGRVWFGGGNDGLFFTGPDLEAPLTKAVTPQSNLHLMHCSRNGDVWFVADDAATSGGEALGFYRGDVPRMLTAQDGYDGQQIRAVAEEAAGQLWFGGHNGDLLRWDGARIARVASGSSVSGPPIHDMIADGSGELWIATAEGLVRYEGGRFHTFTRAEGLPDDLLMQIAEDGAGRLWILGRGGLFYVAKSELREVMLGRAERVSCRIYGRNHGLPALSALIDYHPKTAKSQDGRLWFATSQGAIVIDPATVTRAPAPPPVLIDEVRMNGEALPKSRSLRVPPGRHRLEFLLATPSFSSPEDVQVSYRLQGADTKWIEAGSERMASYRNLPPGSYRLYAKARFQAGAWSEVGAELAFVILPAWWETKLFRGVAVVALLAFITWLIRVISQRALKMRLQRLEREHALEKERARIARDLHDDLGSGLTALGMLAERIGESAPLDVRKMLGGFSWRTRKLAAELSSIVWTMESGNGRLDRFSGFLRQYVQRLFRHTEIVCAIHGVDTIPPIPVAPEPQHQLLSVAKEALNNIVKHAGATEATLTVSWREGIFLIVIGDNGAGFDVSAVSAQADGNGLRNMRTRIAEIGGELTLESVAGLGTTLTVKFPCMFSAPAAATPGQPPAPTL